MHPQHLPGSCFAWWGLHPVFQMSCSPNLCLLFFLIVATVGYGAGTETLPTRISGSYHWNNISSGTESWTQFYALLSPLKRNVKLIFSVANAFCGASAQQKFLLHFSKSGLDRLINLCLFSAAEGWHFIAGEGGESYILCGKITLGQHQRSAQTSSLFALAAK